MRYHALACDYDGTLAHDGRVSDSTLHQLVRLKESGRRLLIVSGRRLEELAEVFPRLDLFERVVVEDGALLYRPATREERVLAAPPPERFAAELRHRGVQRVACGRVIVATWTPWETTVLETIRDLGLELQVIFNKGAVMVLPAGVNKRTGLLAALKEMGLSPRNVVGVGDAENDHAFLTECECAVAVANALPSLKECADLVTAADHGKGVEELAERLLANDLADLRVPRREILLGRRRDGGDMAIPSYATNLLLAGSSGGGKSTFATSFLERLQEMHYQYFLVDPEGDYDSMPGGVVIGDAHRPPSVEEVAALVEKPGENCVVNIVGVPLTDRPGFFDALLRPLLNLRRRTGRPHWIILDEAHHIVPAGWGPAESYFPRELSGMLMITVQPDHLAKPFVSAVDLLLTVGKDPDRTLESFARSATVRVPETAGVDLEAGEALAWWKGSDASPFTFRSLLPHLHRRRHLRKYAKGELPVEENFYFRGPQGKLRLRAQNLSLFLQIAEGIDEETWKYHLRNGDYSRWFRTCIKDDNLAAEAERVERENLSPQESLRRIREIVSAHYTAPE